MFKLEDPVVLVGLPDAGAGPRCDRAGSRAPRVPRGYSPLVSVHTRYISRTSDEDHWHELSGRAVRHDDALLEGWIGGVG